MTSQYSVGIAYSVDAYDGEHPSLAGRHSAGAGFLEAYLRYGNFDTILCVTPSSTLFDRFCAQVAGVSSRKVEVRHVADISQYRNSTGASGLHPTHPQTAELSALTAAGVLYRPDPLINRFAWARRDPGAFALSGITFTLSDRVIWDGLRELPVSPITSADAIICISESGKRVVSRVLDYAKRYLAERFETEHFIDPLLPVIPLGVAVERFPIGEARVRVRATLREKLSLAESEIGVLFVGRLNPRTKANPIPMLLGCAEYAKRGRARIRLIVAGWFENPEEEQRFLKLVAEFAPGIPTTVIRRPSHKDLPDIYSACDIFVSLSDNLQETLGLTPIEAMAAGLPVIVSDWDGYRETVRDGRDGFTVPSIMPSSGEGLDIAAAYAQYHLNHSSFVGLASMTTSVDIHAFVERLELLANSSELRAQMGSAGRARALAEFGWKEIIRRYEELWGEQKQRLGSLVSSMVVGSAPQLSDPFEMFDHYPTRCLVDDTVLQSGQGLSMLEALQQHAAGTFGHEVRCSLQQLSAVVEYVEVQPRAVSEIVRAFNGDARATIIRSLLYLLKFDVLRCVS